MSSIEKAYVHEIELTEQVGNEETTTPLAKLRVFVARSFLNDQNEFEDKHGFWVNVELWGDKAHHLAVVEPGANVLMTGNYLQSKWTDKDGNPCERIFFRAREIAILPRSVASIKYKTKDQAPSGEGENTAQVDAA